MAGKCLRAYRLGEALEVLNEVDVPIWIATYSPERVHFPWCNTANLKMWKKDSVEAFAAIDVFTHRSEAVTKVHHELYTVTQVEKRINHSRHTFYPGGTAVTCDMSFIPIQIINDSDKEETMCVVTCRTAILDMDEGQREVNRSHEMLRHTPVHTLLFTCEGEYLQSNVTARKYYANIHNSMTLKLVLDTCVWEDKDEEFETQDQLLERIQALRLGDPAIKMERKKQARGAGSERSCHLLNEKKGLVITGLEKTGASGRGLSVDTVNSDKVGDNAESYFGISFFPLIDPGTGQPAIMVKEVDITELELKKQAEEELMRAMKQQETFMAAVSHELRTPLNGVIGLTEHVLEELDDQEVGRLRDLEDVRESLKIILHSSKQLCLLINDILDSASLKQGTYQMHFGKVDVGLAISQVCGQLKILCGPEVELKIVDTSDLPMAFGDSGRVCQIMTNLIGNALKFTHEGTVVVSAHLSEDGRFIEVVVEDSGIGIGPADLERVFVPFVQADMSAQRKYEGTGLGLSLVKNLVNAHGGQVSIKSKLEEGTKICFTLHVHTPDEESLEAAIRGASNPNGKPTSPIYGCTEESPSKRLSRIDSDSDDSGNSKHQAFNPPDVQYQAALDRIAELEAELKAAKEMHGGGGGERAPVAGGSAGAEWHGTGGMGRPRRRVDMAFPPAYLGP